MCVFCYLGVLVVFDANTPVNDQMFSKNEILLAFLLPLFALLYPIYLVFFKKP